jgi:hypothetical protein
MGTVVLGELNPEILQLVNVVSLELLNFGSFVD